MGTGLVIRGGLHAGCRWLSGWAIEMSLNQLIEGLMQVIEADGFAEKPEDASFEGCFRFTFGCFAGHHDGGHWANFLPNA